MVIAHIGGNSMSRLGPTGLAQLLTNIKTWVTTKLGDYVTTNTTQTITGKKLFTNAAIQLDNVTSMSGSTMFIDTSAAAPRGEFPAEAHRVGRIYIGDNTSYNGAWFIVDPTIDTNKAYYRMVTTNPDNTDSTRFSITWDSTKEGVRRRRNISMGDLLPSGASTYNLGESGNAWQDAYINKIHGISDYTNLKTNSFNVNTTLTHGGSGRRVISAMGTITLTVPAPEEGSWFLIKAVNGLVTLNLASNVTVTGITAGVFSGPIYLQPNESILLCYYSSTTYNATISTIRRSGVVGRTGNVPAENPKHWFKIAENYVTTTYRDPFICLRVFESTTGNTIGTLCAHCRINNTVGVVDTSNCYLQWQDAGSGIDLSKYALTTNETSGTGVTIALWCQLLGGYSSLKFEVVSECGQSDQLGNPEWVLVRRRQADGDLAELSDTDFTKIVYSTLTTLKNDTIGNAKNVTGTVAIANGGTGATTRLNAVKALTNESVGTPTHFLAITTNWGKAGYTTVAQAKTVLGITGDMGSHSDSEYVHKTGDESISGAKTFSSNITINGTYLGTESSTNERTNIYLLANRDTAEASGAYISRFRQNRTQGAMGSSDVSFISFDFLENSTRYTRCFTMGLTDWDSDGVPQTYWLSSSAGKGSLGTASTPWNKVYATNYYLGSTAFTDKFVTTDTAQTITGVKTLNSDTLVANQGNAYRIANSAGTGYGIFQRTDGTNWYMLVTANDDPLGTWTSARPITIRLSDGYCTINGKANEANKVHATIAADATTSLVQAAVASNDCFRIAAGGAANAGWAEIATGDDANEPIYVRQYKGAFATLQRTATLLDGSGNTSFPGTVTATGFSGPLTGDVTGTASSATEFSANKDVTLTGDVTGTASSKAGWSVATTLANSGVTAGDYGPSADASPAHSGTFTVPSITVDAKGRVTAASTKTITLPSDNNTDTKVTQTVTTANSGYPVLLCATANATTTGTTTSRFSAGLTVNTRYSSIYMTNKYDTANTKGVRNTSSYSNGILYFRSYDDTQMGTIRCESNKGGYQQIYMQASNYIKNGAIDPEGTSTTCLITVRVRDNGGKAIYTDGSWENSLTPYADNTHSLGTSSLKWKNIYANNYYKGTTAFGDIVTHNASEFLTAHPSISINPDPATNSPTTLQNGSTFTYVSGLDRDANGHVSVIFTKAATVATNKLNSIGTRTTTGTWTLSALPTNSVIYLRGTISGTFTGESNYVRITIQSGADAIYSNGFTINASTYGSYNNSQTHSYSVACGAILVVKDVANSTNNVVIKIENSGPTPTISLTAYQ